MKRVLSFADTAKKEGGTASEAARTTKKQKEANEGAEAAAEAPKEKKAEAAAEAP